MTSDNMGLQKEQLIRAQMNEKVILCKVKTVAGNKAFMQVHEEHEDLISPNVKGNTYLFAPHTEEHYTPGKIIQVYENRRKKFIGVQFN